MATAKFHIVGCCRNCAVVYCCNLQRQATLLPLLLLTNANTTVAVTALIALLLYDNSFFVKFFSNRDAETNQMKKQTRRFAEVPSKIRIKDLLLF